MPSTNGLEILVRDGRKWLELIEARREQIKPYLDKCSLKTLGSLECLQFESFKHSINLDGPSVICPGKQFSLETQGIFNLQPYSSIYHVPNTGYSDGRVYVPKDGIMKIWGLTRSNE